jgi:hypothetical protein
MDTKKWLDMIGHKVSEDDIWIHNDYLSTMSEEDVLLGLQQLINSGITDYFNYYPIANIIWRGHTLQRFFFVNINIRLDIFNVLYCLETDDGFFNNFQKIGCKSTINKHRVTFGG